MLFPTGVNATYTIRHADHLHDIVNLGQSDPEASEREARIRKEVGRHWRRTLIMCSAHVYEHRNSDTLNCVPYSCQDPLVKVGFKIPPTMLLYLSAQHGKCYASLTGVMRLTANK